MKINKDAEITACLKINRWQGVALSVKLAALNKYVTFENLLQLSVQDWSAIDGNRLITSLPAAVNIDQDLYWLEQQCQFFLPRTDNRYPENLHHLVNGPLGLYVHGQVEALSELQIAIVGSRKQTPIGQKIAMQFSRKLTQMGIAITSGLAYGIDTSAHIACCEANGLPIAVAGNGLDIVYPRQNKMLAEKVAERGCLISELPIGSPPRRAHFPARNRIISGLSAGVVVVEAAKKSGSLITARLAAEQGKEVFAVPGSIFSPSSAGCHQLIRDGAVLTRDVEDIISELALPITHVLQEGNIKKASDSENCPVLTNMSYDPISVDELIELSGLAFEQLSSKLIELELDGLVKRGHNGRYTRLN